MQPSRPSRARGLKHIVLGEELDVMEEPMNKRCNIIQILIMSSLSCRL